MKHLAFFATVLLFAGTSATLAEEKALPKIRVVLIDGQNNHDWKKTTPLMKKELEETGRFTVDVSTSPPANIKFPPDLSKYDVVVSNYNGAPWPPGLQKSLDERLKEGKIGLVIVHAANNSF